ncbi:glycosyltransferase family 61 protein [Hyphomicrobium zavarzinii]|uniref:glycosyltransferase family 61 protein n=1 Tax=Hyphomicrobium zavarzinii TaxID=48292 RepID=UPI00036477D8|nr:glycosyltransferase family 61 protein [Hyphomicrobium zavarzinii]
MISFRPALHALKQACGLPQAEIESAAVERWVVAPSETRFIPPAKFLPGQIERIREAEFGSVASVVRDFRGGYDAVQEDTLGFRLKDVDLVDGVLYASGAIKHLRPRHRKWPAYLQPREVVSGALYESWVGNTWFGSWLSDDCLTYRLAEKYGAPVTTTMTTGGHVPTYESKLGMKPRRINRAHFEHLILFRDLSQNSHKKARADQFRERVIAGIPHDAHAGVFLLRGSTGMRRVLANERAIAEELASKRGFRILDPSTAPVEEIVSACAGARVVAGVEGSHLVHGLLVMPPDATLFVVQPPERAVSALKVITDRQGQTFAFVVATGGENEFIADAGEIQRTLDLVSG